MIFNLSIYFIKTNAQRFFTVYGFVCNLINENILTLSFVNWNLIKIKVLDNKHVIFTTASIVFNIITLASTWTMTLSKILFFYAMLHWYFTFTLKLIIVSFLFWATFFTIKFTFTCTFVIYTLLMFYIHLFL